MAKCLLVHLGSTGTNLVEYVWTSIIDHHKIKPDSKTEDVKITTRSFFTQVSNKWLANAFIVDSASKRISDDNLEEILGDIRDYFTTTFNIGKKIGSGGSSKIVFHGIGKCNTKQDKGNIKYIHILLSKLMSIMRNEKPHAIILIGSTGGGTGSGFAIELAKVIRKKWKNDKPFLAYAAVIPEDKKPELMFNTIYTLEKIRPNVDWILILENEIIKQRLFEKYKIIESENEWTHVNQVIGKIIANFVSGISFSTTVAFIEGNVRDKTDVDFSDLKHLSTKNKFVYPLLSPLLSTNEFYYEPSIKDMFEYPLYNYHKDPDHRDYILKAIFLSLNKNKIKNYNDKIIIDLEYLKLNEIFHKELSPEIYNVNLYNKEVKSKMVGFINSDSTYRFIFKLIDRIKRYLASIKYIDLTHELDKKIKIDAYLRAKNYMKTIYIKEKNESKEDTEKKMLEKMKEFYKEAKSRPIVPPGIDLFEEAYLELSDDIQNSLQKDIKKKSICGLRSIAIVQNSQEKLFNLIENYVQDLQKIANTNIEIRNEDTKEFQISDLESSLKDFDNYLKTEEDNDYKLEEIEEFSEEELNSTKNTEIDDEDTFDYDSLIGEDIYEEIEDENESSKDNTSEEEEEDNEKDNEEEISFGKALLDQDDE